MFGYLFTTRFVILLTNQGIEGTCTCDVTIISVGFRVTGETRTQFTKAKMELLQFCFLATGLLVLPGSVVSQYTVRVSAVSEMVNRGDDYVAYCNIPDMGALDIIQNLKVKWLHNGKPLTSLCEMLRPELSTKYSCKVLSPQAKNISLELTISDIKPEDAGNLECDVLEKIVENDKWVRDEPVAKKQVKIQVREPIKSMVFKFDSTKEEALTLDNNDAPHRMEVLPGQYSPSCTVEGSNPLAVVKIMKGNEQLQGRFVDIMGTSRTQFMADASEFTGNTQTNVMCSSEVPGLPNSKMERTYQIVVRKMDPKFECSNESAIVNNKRHMITCKVYGVEGIMCNKVTWQRGDDGMNYQLGNHQNINIGCQQVDDSTLQTTLEILQVTSEDFKTPFRVVYSDSLAGTNVHQISIPQEYSNSATLIQSSGLSILLLVSMILKAIL
ncbi:uncharacterized protein LOC111111285 isoform X2 [Crassostrea virginica]